VGKGALRTVQKNGGHAIGLAHTRDPLALPTLRLLSSSSITVVIITVVIIRLDRMIQYSRALMFHARR
jgi:hypothetical protein